MRDLLKSDREKKNVMEVLVQRSDEIEQRANYQGDYNRRCNLRITGVPEQHGGETWEVTANPVSKVLQEKLQLPQMQLERAQCTGQTSPVAGRPRTIVAMFQKFGDREAVVRSAEKLRGTSIFINKDLCPTSLELRSRMPLLKKVKEEG